MDWSEEERKQIVDANIAGRDGVDAAIRAATRAVELYRARLAPSGQVAEDEAFLHECMGVAAPYWSRARLKRADDVLHNLAGGAQARKQAERERDELRADLSRLLPEIFNGTIAADAHKTTAVRAVGDAMAGYMSAAKKERMRLAEERDAARQEAEALRAKLEGATQNEANALEQAARLQEEIDGLRVDLAEALEDRDAWHRKVNGLQVQGVDHAKVLVRAKNEGLERAAKIAEKAGEHGCNTFAGCTCGWERRVDGLPDDIRAMKEEET